MGRAAERARWILRRLSSIARSDQRAQLRTLRAIDMRPLNVGRSWPRRAITAVLSVVREPNSGEIWAVTMVRNEADIIEETVRQLFAQGVQRVVVLDHGSTDETPEILAQLAAKFPLVVLRDPTPGYHQSAKMTMLARHAAAHGAAWVVPFDADELWFGDNGQTLAQVLHSTSANMVTAVWHFFVPMHETGAELFAERFPYRFAEPSAMTKVAFRANWLVHLGIGNHRVYLPDPRIERRLRVAHYSIRTPEQILQKAKDGAHAVRADGSRLGDTPRWEALEHADVKAAGGYMDEAFEGQELLFDPAARWGEEPLEHAT